MSPTAPRPPRTPPWCSGATVSTTAWSSGGRSQETSTTPTPVLRYWGDWEGRGGGSSAFGVGWVRGGGVTPRGQGGCGSDHKHWGCLTLSLPQASTQLNSPITSPTQSPTPSPVTNLNSVCTGLSPLPVLTQFPRPMGPAQGKGEACGASSGLGMLRRFPGSHKLGLLVQVTGGTRCWASRCSTTCPCVPRRCSTTSPATQDTRYSRARRPFASPSVGSVKPQCPLR